MIRHKIRFSCECKIPGRFRLQRHIRRCICAALEAEGVRARCEINVLLTDDAHIREINRDMRAIDRATDVLSFPMFALEAGNPPACWDEYLDPETGLCPLGDLCLSYDHACAQAAEYGHSLRREVGYLTIHSILHLLGYDHLDEGVQKAQMRAREEAIAAQLHLEKPE
ncbi:MAG: rRNA maturation RNase YbeY [Firmicutes bacterium]|nr:rRNA maturation RNase YbeY [Bacillota bacterium]